MMYRLTHAIPRRGASQNDNRCHAERSAASQFYRNTSPYLRQRALRHRVQRGVSPPLAAAGFTLVELIVTIMIVGVVALALVMAFRESLIGLALQRDLQSASLLSEDLMNEIRSRRYGDPQSPTNFGPEEAWRRDFDDVDDYDGWSESPPQTIEGVVMTNYSGFTQQVFVENVTSNFNGAAQPDNSTVFKRITIIVSNATLAVSNVSVVSQYD